MSFQAAAITETIGLDQSARPRRKAWDLKIKVAVVTPAGVIKASAMAELTADNGDCHTGQSLAALFPPGDCLAGVGDGLRFGPNRFRIEEIVVVGEGVEARRKYLCVRSSSQISQITQIKEDESAKSADDVGEVR